MIIKSTKGYKFYDDNGYYAPEGLSLYEEGKGFVTFDGIIPYIPMGGRKALQSILDNGGFIEEPEYIQPS